MAKKVNIVQRRKYTPSPNEPWFEIHFGANAIGWIEGLRQQSSNAEMGASAMMVRTAEALSNETGVNVDTEMALLLDLEHAYEASARIISTVDQMMASLLELV